MPRTFITASNFVLLVLLQVLLTVNTAVAQTCSTPSFTQPPVYPVGSDVRGMASADFDGDGHADIALVDVNSDSLTVFLKLAQDGPPVTNSYAVGRFPLAVAAADFNGDGKIDLVSGNSSSFDLSVFINDGTGHFMQGGTIPVSATPRSLAVADFNLDSKLDIAFTSTSDQRVYVVLGDGNGGFGQQHFVSVGQAVSDVAAADFNTDGKLDLAVTTAGTINSVGGVRILTGDGTGIFTVGDSSCTQSTAGIGLSAGDLNGDTKPDLVLADVLAAQVHVLINNGTGCFGAASNTDVGDFGRPDNVTLGDLNGDGKLDIIGGTAVLLNNGSGTFGAPVFYSASAAVPGPGSVTGDFNGDGKLDIASAGGGSLSLLLGDGAGGIKNAGGPAQKGVFGAVRSDMNSDGKFDLVYFNTNSARIMLGDGNGEFSSPSVVSVTNAFLDSPIVADFNGDTKLDVAGLDSSNNGPNGMQRLFMFPGNGTGGLNAPVSTSFEGNQPVALAGGDFNGDGKFDLVVLNRGGINGSIQMFLGNGAGSFAAPTAFSVGVAVNANQTGVADFNGDGKLDLAIPSGGSVSIMLGNGSGGFSSITPVGTAHAESIAVADFNGDNKPDLAMVSGELNNKLAISLGDGQGGFGPASNFTIGTFPGDVTTADFNGDNKTDIAVSNLNESGSLSTVSVLFNDGSGSFGPKTDYVVERTPTRIIAGDFNSDGKPDIVTANSANNFSVLINKCGTAVGANPIVQFSAPIYSVSEDALVATITVLRSGDTSGEATVNYATSNGIASYRSDYISAFGALHFGPGETSKSFNVLIIDDLRAGEYGESFNVTLSSPVGASLGNPKSAVVAIAENDPTFTTTNPIESAEFFVRQHYFDFLNRVPDNAGLQFWTNEITQCEARPEPERAGCREVKRINVSAAFFLSTEFQQTGYLVFRTYKSAYGDATSPNVAGTVPVVKLNEFLSDSQRLGQGVVVNQGNWEQQLEDNKVDYMHQFVATTRFLTAFPVNMTPAEFVDKLNVNAGGILTQLQRDQLVMQLGAAPDQTLGRSLVLRQVAENQLLSQKEFNRAFVLMQYFGYLRRNPNDPQDIDFSGWKFWLDKLNQFNGNFANAEMVKAFITSIEYRNRFNSSAGF